MKRTIYSIFLILLLFPDILSAQEEVEQKKAVIYQINIDSEINTTSHIYLINGLKEANAMNADAILLHLNTYGGTLVDADSMRSAILYNPVPVYVFIDNNAASAGALIAIACKKIYMREGSSIGAATVVEGVSGQAMPDKYQSYMRSIIRATAESHGKKTIINGNDTIYEWIRDPKIAEAMVDDRISIPNVIDSGKVLTLTAQEAVKLGFCDGIAESADEVITQHMGYKDYKSAEYKPTFLDNLKGFLTNPAFQAILIMIIVAGIYFELQTPGIGFPTFAAIGAAILYFTPLYLDGLVQNWEIIIFLIGIAGIFLEIFIFPGFGVSGILGIICITTGLAFALLNTDYFSFKEVQMPDISRAFLTVLSGFILGFAIILWLSTRIGKKGMFRKVALITDLESSVSVNPAERGLVGKTGTAMTVLRPSGKIMIDNEMYDAVSNQGFIESGKNVKVVKFENMQLYVEE
ncbi:MAG: nodulation protein NfeD [Dysgonamonadaceae bacterium]|jgi:membrane-bound serine protease (ClpP class)|nr:nodulation protein NfeD [Dysgonamonadaceae bacterium]